jgi:hypothetical protein
MFCSMFFVSLFCSLGEVIKITTNYNRTIWHLSVLKNLGFCLLLGVGGREKRRREKRGASAAHDDDAHRCAGLRPAAGGRVHGSSSLEYCSTSGDGGAESGFASASGRGAVPPGEQEGPPASRSGGRVDREAATRRLRQGNSVRCMTLLPRGMGEASYRGIELRGRAARAKRRNEMGSHTHCAAVIICCLDDASMQGAGEET